MTDAPDSWEKFLNPVTLRANLIHISLFIAAFEMFKARVIEKPETFFSTGFDQNGLVIGDEYKSQVLSKSKSQLYASLLWLKEMEAVDDADIDIFDAIRQHRNEIVHKLLEFLSDDKRDLDVGKFEDLVGLLSKIERWWLVNFELAIDPEMMPEDANVDDVIPGPILSLRLMLDVALGGEPEEGYYYNAYKTSAKRGG
jgi:hypothetical protein